MELGIIISLIKIPAQPKLNALHMAIIINHVHGQLTTANVLYGVIISYVLLGKITLHLI